MIYEVHYTQVSGGLSFEDIAFVRANTEKEAKAITEKLLDIDQITSCNGIETIN